MGLTPGWGGREPGFGDEHERGEASGLASVGLPILGASQRGIRGSVLRGVFLRRLRDEVYRLRRSQPSAQPGALGRLSVWRHDVSARRGSATMARAAKNGYCLFKQEPDCYNYSALQRDGGTVWDGVSNALAQKNLRQVRVGDRVFFYHTGKEKAVVGEMVVTAGPRPASDDESLVVVEVAPVRSLAPVVLKIIKEDPQLTNWDLVRLPRLSVVPVTPEQWRRVIELSKQSGPGS
jgi:predicted RNA-binding protein with PUA-like domain